MGADSGATVTQVTSLPTAPMKAFSMFANTSAYLGAAWDIHNGF